MAVYLIAQIDIHDREEYQKYEAGFLEIFSEYQGEILVVNEDPVVIEGEWPYTRTVVLRFPSVEEAMRWGESSEYQVIAQHRFRAATTNAIMVEGIQPLE